MEFKLTLCTTMECQELEILLLYTGLIPNIPELPIELQRAMTLSHMCPFKVWFSNTPLLKFSMMVNGTSKKSVMAPGKITLALINTFLTLELLIIFLIGN